MILMYDKNRTFKKYRVINQFLVIIINLLGK